LWGGGGLRRRGWSGLGGGDGCWLYRWRFGIGRGVIGGLFVGLADGFAPVIRVVGVDVFVAGEGQGLHHGLAEVG
jgi:hypothetical protein